MAKIAQYFKDKAKTIKDYPKTLMKAVYGDDGQRLDNVLSAMNSTMNEFGEYKGVSTILSGTVSLKDTSLVSGHYVCDSIINGPDDTRLTGGYIDVEAHPNSAYRKVKFSPYGLNEWYVITCSGGTWSGWEKLITNSNLSDVVTIIVATLNSLTVAANGYGNMSQDISSFIPNGYKCIGACFASSGSSWFIPIGVYLIGTSVQVYVRNTYAGQDQGAPIINLICIRN